MVDKPTILFDFNGTLVDSKQAQVESWRLALDDNDLLRKMTCALEGLAQGRSSYEIASDLTNDPVQQLALIKRKRELFDRLLFTAGSLFPYESEALNVLMIEGDLHVISLYSEPNIRKWLKAVKCLHNFKSITGRRAKMEQTTKGVLLKSFVAKHRTEFVIFVGDTERDWCLAREFGLSFLLMRVPDGPMPANFPEEGVINCYADLIKKITNFHSTN